MAGENGAVGNSNRPLFTDIKADEELETSRIESLCMQCGETGITRLMLTKIPMFREVVLMSFSCPHCHASNNEIQSGTAIQDKGIRITFLVQTPQDTNRQMLKSDTASFLIPDLDFEVPPNTQKGVITTVEGVFEAAITGLEQDQVTRRATDPEVAAKIDDFILQLKVYREVKSPFKVVLDDPTGNSFVENPFAPHNDPSLTIEHYVRTPEQDLQLGIAQMTLSNSDQDNLTSQQNEPISSDEVLSLPSNCPSCNTPSETKMKLTNIPYFKEVVLMALNCEACGHRSNEVKTGGGISDKGVKFTLHITSMADLNRDVLKAETAVVSVPELELEVESGNLSGRFTTIEGLLDNIKCQLLSVNPFAAGDSNQQVKFAEFIRKLNEVIEGTRSDIHLVLDDPAGNSYIQNPYAPNKDSQLVVEEYVRTYEQNDSLGLNEMKTENYT